MLTAVKKKKLYQIKSASRDIVFFFHFNLIQFSILPVIRLFCVIFFSHTRGLNYGRITFDSMV